MRMLNVVGACLALTLASHSMAAVQPNNKAITVNITLTQMGVPLKGTFQQATVSGDIPDQGAGNVSVLLNTQSLSGLSQEAVSVGRGPTWLNAATFPSAKFKSTSLQVNGGKGMAQGLLTIKGITKPATAAFTVRNGKVQGQLTFDRTPFQLGTGEWSSTSIIAAPVKIDFAF